ALVRRVAQSGEVAPEHRDALNACVQALIRQHRNEASAGAIPNWFYRIHWDHKPRNGKVWSRARDPGRWLILGERGGLGGELLRLLEREGASCVLYPATDFHRNGAGQQGASWRVDPDWLHGETSDRPPTAFRGIVHLGALNAPAPDALTAASLAQWQDRICSATLQLVQDLARGDWDVAPKLWLVTHGAISTDDLPLPENALANAVSPRIGQAPLWGMGRVIRLEHPDLWGGLVDLAPEREAREQADALLAELLDADGEDQVALREGRRCVPRLRPVDPASWGQGLADGAGMARIGAGRTYLITGGLGSLGLAVAEWMVERGARSLVLAGRSAASADAARRVADWEGAGARIVVARADISVESDVARVLGEIGDAMPPLGGIIHAAAVFDDGILLKQDGPRMSRV
ncbi:MAG: SDR family NAD(P)-dependent oxidoreductase, partial [bacterium]